MPGTIPEMSPDEGRAAVADGAMLLDVREAGEWEAGHAPAAQWIPMGEIPERSGELPTGSKIVVICRSGGRSGKVTEFLVGQGIDAVNLVGGMQAWASSGFDVVTDAGTPGTVA